MGQQYRTNAAISCNQFHCRVSSFVGISLLTCKASYYYLSTLLRNHNSMLIKLIPQL